MIFYVYRIYDLTETVYIGKGTGRRLQRQMVRFGRLGEIVRRFGSEEEAYAFEKRLIAKLKPPLNKVPGGGGSRYGATRVPPFGDPRALGMAAPSFAKLIRKGWGNDRWFQTMCRTWIAKYGAPAFIAALRPHNILVETRP